MATLNLLGWHSSGFYPLQSALFCLLLCVLSVTKGAGKFRGLVNFYWLSACAGLRSGRYSKGRTTSRKRGRETEREREREVESNRVDTCGFLVFSSGVFCRIHAQGQEKWIQLCKLFWFYFFFKCIVTSFYLFHLFLFISFFFNIIAALRDMTIHNITCTKGLLQEKINCNGF